VQGGWVLLRNTTVEFEELEMLQPRSARGVIDSFLLGRRLSNLLFAWNG